MSAVKKPAAAKKPAPAKKPAAERMDTERVVVRRVRAIELPVGISGDQQKEVAKLLGVKVADVPVVEAWQVVGTFRGGSKDAAIKAYAGEPGTPDAKVGDYKAPGVSAWKGGMRFVAPPRPLVQAEAID